MPAARLGALPWIILAVVALLAGRPAPAVEVQPFRWTVTVDGRAVGEREAGIRYLPGPSGEVRLLESWLALEAPNGGPRLQQRLAARLGGDRSFSSSVRLNDEVREVQGRLSPDGSTWIVTVAEGVEARTWHHPASAVDLTSAELMDPERALRVLEQAEFLRILSTETGLVLDGPVVRLGGERVAVGGQPLEVVRFRWTPEAGAAVFAFSEDGVLVSHRFGILGRDLDAALDRLPPPRNYGAGLEVPVIPGAIREE